MEFDFETENSEFKQEYTPTIKKEVIAFANTSGGIIYVGVDKNGKICPVEDIDGTTQKITNAIRDSILPDLTYLVKYEVEGKQIIKITVSEGTKKPYFLADKGLTPSGVYVRQGTSSAPASHDLIRKMIKISDGESYEGERSLNQELTFEETASEFRKKDVAFKENHKVNLGIKSKYNLYTNLGLILSDQFQHTIKMASFRGEKNNSQMEFKTREEAAGAVVNQFYEATVFLKAINNLPAKIVGFERMERYDYPPDALREALLNAIIHRDYSFSGSIMIKVYDDCIDFISLGGLVAGLQEEDLFEGISQPRNEKLANIFLRLNYVEAYGTGLRKIMDSYKDSELKPTISLSQNVFVITLPNLNYMQTLISELDPKHKKILAFIKMKNYITNSDVQNLFIVKKAQAYKLINQMKKLDLIKEGKKRGEYISNT